MPFTDIITHWYDLHGRDLPWRETHDPYRVWVSEIILQQTRVEQGMAYYHRFIQRWQDVHALAAADEEEVLRLWQGLGYYSRARHMHAAARQIHQRGSFPTDYDAIRSLPGVGDYTAAAIASFAFGEPHAVVDGNVYRVLSRYFDEPTPIDSTRGKRLFAQLAHEMLDPAAPARYNQAIMDFGAMVCTPQPDCCQCPLSSTCMARAHNTIKERPVKSHRTKVSDRYLTYICVENEEGEVLLHRRAEDDIWQGLYQFTLLEADHLLSPAEVERQLPPGTLTGKEGEHIHLLSHQRLHARFYHLKVCKEICTLPGRWVRWADVDNYALPRLITRYLNPPR
ncbi:MAG: A/G-specific adenine glycosylase [Bacteroidaceae bacterium]|nr:A/G-specific adenine glycosylase [Bacteroidaceae bacterium]